MNLETSAAAAAALSSFSPSDRQRADSANLRYVIYLHRIHPRVSTAIALLQAGGHRAAQRMQAILSKQDDDLKREERRRSESLDA